MNSVIPLLINEVIVMSAPYLERTFHQNCSQINLVCIYFIQLVYSYVILALFGCSKI